MTEQREHTEKREEIYLCAKNRNDIRKQQDLTEQIMNKVTKQRKAPNKCMNRKTHINTE
jgi:hypothetical protein